MSTLKLHNYYKLWGVAIIETLSKQCYISCLLYALLESSKATKSFPKQLFNGVFLDPKQTLLTLNTVVIYVFKAKYL